MSTKWKSNHPIEFSPTFFPLQFSNSRKADPRDNLTRRLECNERERLRMGSKFMSAFKKIAKPFLDKMHDQ